MATATTNQPSRTEGFSQRKEAARLQIARAFALEGFVRDGKPVCPSCGTAVAKRVKLFTDGGAHCHKCKWHVHNAIDLLCETRVRVRSAGLVGVVVARTKDTVTYRDRLGNEQVAGIGDVGLEGGEWEFREAVKALLGEEHTAPEGRAPCELPDVDLTASFTATQDPEVYECVLASGDVDAAVEFYARFGISPEVTIASRATRITSQGKLISALRKNFEPERIVASGLATEEGYLLISDRYPVIEPHLAPAGWAAGMQFRGSEIIERRAKAHAKYKRQRAAVEAAGGTWRGEKVPHVSKFRSLKGAPLNARVGFGLANIAAAQDQVGRRLWIVEGFKDTLAAETFGLLAYGLPGSDGLLPPAPAVELMRPFRVSIVFDGDNAGRNGAPALAEHLERHFGIKAEIKELPDGRDVTDMLMEREGITLDD